jgi:hypothetical protein
MNLLLTLGCGVLIVLVAVVLGYPLFYNRRQTYVLASAEQIKHLNERKETLYAAIRELTFDLELGKLPQVDYQRLLEPLENEAVELLRQLDQFNGRAHSQTLMARLEADVLTLRDGKTDHQADHLAQKTSLQCHACQAPLNPQDRFCSQCGAPFKDYPAV